jgi:DNA helicase HerA-like ATPase
MNYVPSSHTAPVGDDPRLAAFLAPGCPEIFHSVATPTAICSADPYDVETIHAEARSEFERLLHRGSRDPLPPSGTVLVLLGEAGSGKTHLMRAFRTRAHVQGWGYCGYLQMTTEAGNYARYMLNNLIDSLEQPYAPEGPTGSGLGRLSGALLEAVPNLTRDEQNAFREGEGDATKLVDDYADRLCSTERFYRCDLALVRILLHLERHEPRAHRRALMWLRCEAMRPQDCGWIGQAVPRNDDADPLRMLRQLATVLYAVHQTPLVLLIDQLEDIANQSTPAERFLKVVDAITAFTDNIPNTVVVMACLEDYFKVNADKLIKAKQDRLLRDPEPIRLASLRSSEEIREMVARRLGHLYDDADVDIPSDQTLFPFREEHLQPLTNLRSRDVLDFLRRHHQRCITAGCWVEPTSPTRKAHDELDVHKYCTELDAAWNTFHSQFTATVPDEAVELAALLANTIRLLDSELPGGFHCECSQDRQYLEVEAHAPDDSVDRKLVGLCNANTRGTKFGKQLTDLAHRAGEIPVVIVRTTDFPKSGKAVTQIAGMLKRHGERVVASDADWRRMLAFDAFRQKHMVRSDFAVWQRQSQPLSELETLKRILKLNTIASVLRPGSATEAPVPAPSSARPDRAVRSNTIAPATPDASSITLGRTLSLASTPVVFASNEFTQHAAFLGGTGSGKTTAALNLIEQLLARGIPAVLVDRKGDLCRYADPAAWERPLSDPAREAARRCLREKLDVVVFTPGEPTGRPLAIPVAPPGFEHMPEADRERFAQYAAAALGSMIGFKTSDADKGQRAILAKAIETLAAVPGAKINVQTLRNVIENQDDALLTAIGGGYPEAYYGKLANRLLTLELNNRQLLTGGEVLDIDALLGVGTHARTGRVRLSVISTRFLGDGGKVDFWVSQLLTALSRWCAKSPQPHLQAVFLFDEADIYLPAGTKQPAAKAPMEDLLKRARSAGVGIFLASQSPGDFDYKCKENVRTWLIGNVKQPQAIQKLKPMLTAAKGAVADKLAGQVTGEFYLVRESNVVPVQSDESFIRTEQMPEDAIAELARCTASIPQPLQDRTTQRA